MTQQTKYEYGESVIEFFAFDNNELQELLKILQNRIDVDEVIITQYEKKNNAVAGIEDDKSSGDKTPEIQKGK